MAAKTQSEAASENLATGAEPPSDERGIGDNSVHRVVKKQFSSFVSRIENIDGELKMLRDDKASIFAEAKAKGYDVKAMRQVLRERAADPQALADHYAVVDVYRSALGMVSFYRDQALAERDGAA